MTLYTLDSTNANDMEIWLWHLHCRAAEQLDVAPGPTARANFDAIHYLWRQSYLGVVE